MDNKTARPAESAATASGPIQKIHNNYSQLDSNSQQKTHQIKSIPSDVYRLAHIGNAKRFCKQHGHKVRCVPAWKKWIIYDGKRWKIDETNQIRILAHGTAKSIHDEAKLADDEKIMQAISRWAVQSCKTPAIDAMLKEAAPSLSVIPDQLDSDPWLLNCNNGTLDLTLAQV